jgi:hypothetical protein
MAQQKTSTRRNRFWDSTISELQEANHNPVLGYRHLPVVSLEEAVKSIDRFVPHIEDYVEKAKEGCKKNTPLTINESAAIYLYTMPDCCFHDRLNKACRTGNPYALEPWFPFLKLFITALRKLPSCSTTMWRGVGDITGSDFLEYDVHTWWSVNSCSSRVNVAGIFAGETGTLFCINAIYAKDITAYAANQDEEEFVLMPGTFLRVKRMDEENGRCIVLLEEW